MRVKDMDDNTRFANYEHFGKTEVFADCIGPLIDISKISGFSGIEDARYLTEDELRDKLLAIKGVKYTNDQIWSIVKDALEHSKTSINYVDSEMVMLLCKAKSFCTIKIVSTVQDVALYELVKDLLINFSKHMIRFNLLPDDNKDYLPLDDGDFTHIQSPSNPALPGIIQYCSQVTVQDYPYKVAIDDDALAYSAIAGRNIPSFQEWIGGIRENETAKRLGDVLEKRKHIFDGIEAIKSMCQGPDNDTILLKNYTIMNSYYVFDDELKTQLEKRIIRIKEMTEKDKAKTHPICVFLAGKPGTGKSYFVNCFAKSVKCDSHYPVTSLSGVSSGNFYGAIQSHVEQVYNLVQDRSRAVSVAFLDEIDTESDYYAFRFLMDAMTGSRTDENGVAMRALKSGSVENLVWFFAGSAGATRQEIMCRLNQKERKVIDFFDRIHFDLQLPAVEVPGQAILTLMSAIKSYWNNASLPTRISIKVLLAFACTRWNSTRSIMTICRVAAAKWNNEPEITIDLFEDIDTSEEFHKQCVYIKEHVDDVRMINIEWDGGAEHD